MFFFIILAPGSPMVGNFLTYQYPATMLYINLTEKKETAHDA